MRMKPYSEKRKRVLGCEKYIEKEILQVEIDT